MKKILRKIGIMIMILILISAAIIFFVLARKASPPQIVANFTELNKIGKISKYRSCAGHTTVPQDKREMKRSMKHYFSLKPEYLGSDTIKIYAPFDGYVTTIRQDPAEGLEGEIWIAPKDIFAILPPIGRWTFSVQHINIREGLKRGKEVKAGELIGYGAVSASANRDTFDVVYGKSALAPKILDNWRGPFSDLDSVFNHMSADVFAEYQKKGIFSKEYIVTNKEQRDQNPCVYKDSGPYFLNYEDSDNWVMLRN